MYEISNKVLLFLVISLILPQSMVYAAYSSVDPASTPPSVVQTIPDPQSAFLACVPPKDEFLKGLWDDYCKAKNPDGAGSNTFRPIIDEEDDPVCSYIYGPESGLADDFYALGEMYRNGEFFPQNDEKAFACFMFATHQRNRSDLKRNMDAAGMVLQLFQEGRGAPQDSEKLAKWQEQQWFWLHAYGDNARPEYQYMIGCMWAEARNVPISNKQATDCIWCAANNNYGPAQYKLGRLLEEGECGFHQDDSEAFKWFLRAAQNGNMYGLYRMASCIEEGAFFQKGYAVLESIVGLKVANRLKKLESNGDIKKISGDRAAELYERAAEQGHKAAQYRLGLLYEEGDLGDKYFNVAAQWYYLAANQEHRESQYRLGLLYEKGHLEEGVNYEEAVYWYTCAADQEHNRAQYRLGFIYGTGRGVPVDTTAADYWYERAGVKTFRLALSSPPRCVSNPFP